MMILVDGVFFLSVKERKDLTPATYGAEVLLFVLVHHQVRLEAMRAEMMPRGHISGVRPYR